MQIAEFKATCRYEIGDLVYVSGINEWGRIDDILCIHSIKSGIVNFELIIDSVNGINLNQTSITVGSPLIQKMIPNNEVEARRNEWDKNRD